MNLTCSHCGQPLVVDGPVEAAFDCPACGHRITSSAAETEAAPLLAAESERERWLQQRRRATLVIALCLVCWLALMAWFLIHPSSATSSARQAKNALFGRRVTDAVEQAMQQSGQEGAGEGQQNGQGQPGQSGQPGQPGSNQPQGNQTPGREGPEGEGQPGTAPGEAGNPGRQRDPRARGTGNRPPAGGTDAPINPQHPESNAPDLPASPERSIGWLDRFFGTQPSGSEATRAGEGGTGSVPGAGNTNVTSTRPPHQVAAEFTETAPSQTNVADLDTPPPPRRTNRVVSPTNTALNDNMEQLLRQHRAGSGDVRVSLMWNNKNDLDLHVVDPRGEEIYYQHKDSHSGGRLDIDMNAGGILRAPAVENVFWPDRGAPAGTYRVYVNHYSQKDRENQTAFTVRILIRGRTTDFPGSIRFGERKKLIHEFTISGR